MDESITLISAPQKAENYLNMVDVFVDTGDRSRTTVERSVKENKQPVERQMCHQSMGRSSDGAR
jgi:hypothetical protein